MSRSRTAVVALTVALVVALLPSVALAQGAGSEWKLDLRLDYWYGASKASDPGGQFGNWDSHMWGFEFNAVPTRSRTGFGANFYTGNQTNGGGGWTGLVSGTDQQWSGWVNYHLLPPQSETQANLWVGYGSFMWDTTFFGGISREVFKSNGVMAGLSYYAPVARNVDFGGTFIWYPSNSNSLDSSGTLTTGSGSAYQYMVNLKYECRNWAFLAGYRGTTVNAGNNPGCTDCKFERKGLYVQAIYEFPH